MTRKVPSCSITLIETPFGRAGIAWRGEDTRPTFIRIYLPDELSDPVSPPPAHQPPQAKVARLAMQIRRFLAGDAIDFPFETFDLTTMSAFQREALLLCREIPRGRVASYGGLASRLKVPGGARAVGTAMARNPFPLVIPCHRVVRTGGDSGRFGGGDALKTTLLHMEGVRFDGMGKVLPEHFW